MKEARRLPRDPVDEFYGELGLAPMAMSLTGRLGPIRAALARYLRKPADLTERLPRTVCWNLIREIEAALGIGADPAAVRPRAWEDWMKHRGIGPHTIRSHLAPLGLLTGGGGFRGAPGVAREQEAGFRTAAT